MKVEAELTHPDRVDITLTITADFNHWEAIHDALRIGIEAQAKVGGSAQELNVSINEVLERVATLGKQGLEKRE